MAARHDPNKLGRAYFQQPRDSKPLPRLPDGYTWKKQIEKYCPEGLLSKLTTTLPRDIYLVPKEMVPKKLVPKKIWDSEDLSDKTAEQYRTEMDEYGRPTKHKSNFNRLSGVFCHRGFYDQAMKIPENSSSAIDYGQQYGFRLHELDIKLHTNSDKSLNTRKAFLSHDATGAATTAEWDRWSQNDGREAIGTVLVTRGINLEKKDYASTWQETDAKIPGLEDLLATYDTQPWGETYDSALKRMQNVYNLSTFQIDVSQPGDAFAQMLAWFRYYKFNGLNVIIKGYNRYYADGPTLLKAVDSSFSLRTGALIDTFRAHTDPFAVNKQIISVACNGPRLRIATGSRDGKVRIWESHTNSLKVTLEGHRGAVQSVAFSRKYPWVVSGSDDRTVRIWDFDTGQTLHELRNSEGRINSVVFSDEHMQVAAATEDHRVLVWNIDIKQRTCKLQQKLKGHKRPVTAVAYPNRAEHRWLASSSLDGTLRLWDVNQGTLLRKFSDHTCTPSCIALDNYFLAVGSVEGIMQIWDTETGKLLNKFQGYQGNIEAVALDAGDQHVAATAGKSVKIWKVYSGELYQELKGHTANVTCLAFGVVRGTRALITTSSDGEVRIWAYRTLHEQESPDRGRMNDGTLGMIMVFYSQPIMNIALTNKGLPLKLPGNPMNDWSMWMERLEKVTFDDLKQTAREHIRSFIENPIPTFGHVIPEIVHSGLGLGYNNSGCRSLNPKNGDTIKSAEVTFNSRLDRAMIEVSLELRQRYPHMVFSSCTRLSDVYLAVSDAEFTRDLMKGSLKPQIAGDDGIAARLRTVHGGMYPQSDLVVADDPIAEIAARTWIDEFARLDRSQLLTMTYDDWLAQDPLLKEVVDELNGKFWSNTVGRASDAVGNSSRVAPEQDLGPTLASSVRVQRRADTSEPELTGSGVLQGKNVSKSRWGWKRS